MESSPAIVCGVIGFWIWTGRDGEVQLYLDAWMSSRAGVLGGAKGAAQSGSQGTERA